MELFPERQTRTDTSENLGAPKFKYHDYLMIGCPEKALRKCVLIYIEIIEKLSESLESRLSSITTNPLYIGVATLLDTKSYQFTDSEDIFDSAKIITETFKKQLEANGCNLNQLQKEFDIVYNHVLNFGKNKESEKLWPLIFTLKDDLGVRNILHLVEIGLALPISNAESERVFSFLWRVFSKERTNLKTKLWKIYFVYVVIMIFLKVDMSMHCNYF